MDDTEIEQKCLDLIDENGKETLQSAGFKMLKHEMVRKIIARDKLDVDEVHVWLASLEWASAECKRQGKQVKWQVLAVHYVEQRYSIILFLDSCQPDKWKVKSATQTARQTRSQRQSDEGGVLSGWSLHGGLSGGFESLPRLADSDPKIGLL